MALPVVLKSGKNYITLVLDSEIEFADLLQHIVAKFLESEKFFGEESFALMFDGRALSDREKLIILDAIDAYTSIKITRIIENDIFREYAAEKYEELKKANAIQDDEDDDDEDFDDKSNQMLSDNCIYVDHDVVEGEKISAEENIVVVGNVYSGAILKAGNNIVVLGLLEGQAIAGSNPANKDAYIMAKDFHPENFRIGRVLGKSKNNKKGLKFRRKASSKIAKLVDGEILIYNYN